MKPETCRDVLAELLAAASNISDLADQLDGYGYPVDRIRAAIAAVDAELERVATGGDRVRALAWMMLEQWAKTAATESRSTAEAAAARLVRDVMPGWFNAARIDLGTGIDRYGLMRQLDAAQRIAGDGGRDDG